MYIDRGTLDDLQKFALEKWSVEEAQSKLNELNADFPEGDGFGSDVVVLYPQKKITPGEKK